jgi:hypothetical protein
LANPSHLDLYPLEPISAEHWSRAQIGYMEYVKDRKCRSTTATGPGLEINYSDIHFDALEVASIWPEKKRRKFKLRMPFELADAG